MLSLLFVSFFLYLTVNAARNKYVVHERRNLQHDPWLQRESAGKDLIVRARIALTQQSLENGHDWLMDV